MNLPVMNLEGTVARRGKDAYRREARRTGDPRDVLMARVHSELAAGRPLIRLGEAMRAGRTVTKKVWSWGDLELGGRGMRWDHVHLPALAIARTQVSVVFTHGVHADGGCQFREQNRPANPRIDIPAGTFSERNPDVGLREIGRTAGWQALVPTCPPHLRPRGGIDDCHVLWEAEWEETPTAPGDPALLRHIVGDLFAVLAVWDLTPLEQAVLEGMHVEL